MFVKHSEGGHETDDRSQDLRQVVLDVSQKFPDLSVSANGNKLRILSKDRKGADIYTGNPAVSALLAELESKRLRISGDPVEIENDGNTWKEFVIDNDNEK